MKNIENVTAQIMAIPKERRSAKYKKTAMGAAFAALGIAGASRWGWPWYVTVSLCIVGAHIASSDLTTMAVKFVIASIKDILAAVKGSKDDEPPAAGGAAAA